VIIQLRSELALVLSLDAVFESKFFTRSDPFQLSSKVRNYSVCRTVQYCSSDCCLDDLTPSGYYTPVAMTAGLTPGLGWMGG